MQFIQLNLNSNKYVIAHILLIYFIIAQYDPIFKTSNKQTITIEQSSSCRQCKQIRKYFHFWQRDDRIGQQNRVTSIFNLLEKLLEQKRQQFCHIIKQIFKKVKMAFCLSTLSHFCWDCRFICQQLAALAYIFELFQIKKYAEAFIIIFVHGDSKWGLAYFYLVLKFEYLSVLQAFYINILKILSNFSTFLLMHPIASLPFQFINTFPQHNPIYGQNYCSSLTESYFLQVMNYQNQLNFQLLKNQSLIAGYLNTKGHREKAKSTTATGSSTSQYFQNSIAQQAPFYPALQLKTCNIDHQQHREQAKIHLSHVLIKNQRKQKKNMEDEQYEPEKSQSQNFKVTKSSQSKNVPKNFSKAILLFIKRKQNIIRKIVEQFNVNYSQFMQMAQTLKGKVNSIQQLRSLWLQQSNKFAKIFRIISNLYIRKNALKHIFNSRIQDFTKHLKYRNKISQVLKQPREFTRMKDY